MVSGNLLFDVGNNFRLGVGTYGAVRGERGGFIALGVAGEYSFPLTSSLDAHAGLFVGAGGGRGGLELSGGGLMLRGDLGLLYRTSFGNIGVGISRVSFPSGVIESTQPYIRYEQTFQNLLGDGWGRPSPAWSEARTPLLSRTQEFGVVLKHYAIPASVVRSDGSPQRGSLQLVGVQWVSQGRDGWFIKAESEGAMGGQSDGYMQILAGGGYRFALSKNMTGELFASAGPAGGGGVATGGGLLAEAGIGLQYRLGTSAAIEATLSRVRASSGGFQATSVGLQLMHRFDTPLVTAGASLPTAGTAGYDPTQLRVRVSSQRYQAADPAWRNQDAASQIDNLGVQVDKFFASNWYLTGQGLAAYRGDAGAYMVGLIGAGHQWNLSRDWFLDLEALVGAAGGGGMAVKGGLVAQTNAGIGYRLSDSLAIMATLGRITAIRGPFEANVGGVSLTYQFTGFARNP